MSRRGKDSMHMPCVKFLQSIDPQVYLELRMLAKERGVSLQELLRAVIIPDWMHDKGLRSSGKGRIEQAQIERRIRWPAIESEAAW